MEDLGSELQISTERAFDEKKCRLIVSLMPGPHTIR